MKKNNTNTYSFKTSIFAYLPSLYVRFKVFQVKINYKQLPIKWVNNTRVENLCSKGTKNFLCLLQASQANFEK